MPEEVEIKDAEQHMRWYRQLWEIKDTIIIIATPLLLLPIVILYPDSKPAKCAYTIIIMGIFWMTEVIPMAVTALIPIVLFPWLGVMSSKNVCPNYLKDANMLFFGGLLVAVAVEKWNLHKRVALRVLMLVGSKPMWILFGFMSVTTFLSMWLNNTATTAMMMPIAQAVLKELDENRKRQLRAAHEESIELLKIDERQGNGEKSDDILKRRISVVSMNLKKSQNAAITAESDQKFMAFRKALKLSIPYSSSIGGTGTLIGTGPNIVFKGQLEAMNKNADTGINFTSWLVIGFPAMVVDFFFAWILIMLIFLGPKETFACRKKKNDEPEDDSATQVISAEYKKLGKISFAEVVVLINFIILALMWFFREPEFIPGWGASFRYVTDASLSITISVLLFVFPSKWPNYLCFRRNRTELLPGPSPPILDWPTVNKQMPWSVIILLGGGFALADACKASGLSVVIGDALTNLRVLPPWVIVMIMCILATVVTSFTSNMATVTIFLPILAEIARTTCVNPLYLMMPVTLAASWAYVLPVSTPPNAIAFSYGDLVINDMMKAGVVMCFLCNAVLLFSINTRGYSFLNLGVFPDWAVSPDSNCSALIPYNNSIFLNDSIFFNGTTLL